MISIPRRRALATILVAAATPAIAQDDWRRQFKIVRFSVTTAENENDRVRRYEPMLGYLQRRLGVSIELRNVSDYAGVIEALRARQVEVARMGPAAYARGWDTAGGKFEAFAADQNEDGSTGYFSVIAVRADSPIRSLDELAGKPFAFADQNSASGFQIPSYYLRRDGKDPQKFFGRVQFSGSHENSVIALLNGTFDGIAIWWTNDQRNNYARMVGKGMVPPDRLRVVWKSPLIQNGPWVVHADLPVAMKDDIKRAVLSLPADAPDVWRTLTDGQLPGLTPVTHADYVDLVAITRENVTARRTN